MDKCSANSVDSDDIHKVGMVMNELHISVYIGDVRVCSGHVHIQLMSKMLGRIGVSPLIRFGTYTCGACAVSCTLKWDVVTVMEYKGLSLQQAVDYYVRGTMQNIRRQLLSIISQYKLFTNLYQCLQITYLSGTIIRGTLKAPNSQLVTPISIKLQRPDGYN
jgi:hypothetical protein